MKWSGGFSWRTKTAAAGETPTGKPKNSTHISCYISNHLEEDECFDWSRPCRAAGQVVSKWVVNVITINSMVTEKQQQQTTNGSLIEKKDKMQQRPVKKYR